MNQGQIVDALPSVAPNDPGQGPHYRGYRVDPHAPADDAVWFMGCSMVWGFELAPHKTVAHTLAEITGLNVINLGVNSAGTAWVRFCIERLLAQGHRPRAVVIAWPGFSRWLSWRTDSDCPVFWAGWALDLVDPRSRLRQQQYPKEYSQFRRLFLDRTLDSMGQVDRLETLKLLKEQGIPCLEFGYYYTFEDLLPLGVKVLPEPVDYTQDQRHPGPISQFKTAVWVRDQMSSLGWLSSS